MRLMGCGMTNHAEATEIQKEQAISGPESNPSSIDSMPYKLISIGQILVVFCQCKSIGNIVYFFGDDMATGFLRTTKVAISVV